MLSKTFAASFLLLPVWEFVNFWCFLFVFVAFQTHQAFEGSKGWNDLTQVLFNQSEKRTPRLPWYQPIINKEVVVMTPATLSFVILKCRIVMIGAPLSNHAEVYVIWYTHKVQTGDFSGCHSDENLIAQQNGQLLCTNRMFCYCVMARFVAVKVRLHMSSAFAFLSNGFFGNKWWCLHLMLKRDGKDQRKKQTQTPYVNLPLVTCCQGYTTYQCKIER